MKVLYVVKNIRVSNGVASFIMNYYRNLMKNKDVQIDFLITKGVPTPYYEEIKKNGSKIYEMPSMKHIFRVFKYLDNLFKNNKYDIVHCNEMNYGAFVQKYAKKNKIKARILHCHGSVNGDNLLKKIAYSFTFKICKNNSNVFFACSQYAGERMLKNKNFTVINNAIKIDDYIYKKDIREKIRKENKIDNNKIVISTVGRITYQKNPFYIVDLLNELKRKNIEFVFWWFGSGDLDNEVREYTKEKGLTDSIVFFGSTNNVNYYYSAMDLFLFPSLSEGLGMALIEAQCSGLPCIASTGVPIETKINDNVYYLSLKEPKKIWIDKILELKNSKRNVDIKKMYNSKYNIQNETEKLLKLYRNLL